MVSLLFCFRDVSSIFRYLFPLSLYLLIHRYTFTFTNRHSSIFPCGVIVTLLFLWREFHLSLLDVLITISDYLFSLVSTTFWFIIIHFRPQINTYLFFQAMMYNSFPVITYSFISTTISIHTYIFTNEPFLSIVVRGDAYDSANI